MRITPGFMTSFDIRAKEYEFSAYCDSFRCNRNRYATRTGVIKHVPKGLVSCPDCGWPLLWVKKQVRKGEQ